MIPALPEMLFDAAALRPVQPAAAGVGAGAGAGAGVGFGVAASGAGQHGAEGMTGFAGLLEASQALLGAGAQGTGMPAMPGEDMAGKSATPRPALPALPANPDPMPVQSSTDLPPGGAMMPPARLSPIRIAPAPLPTIAIITPQPIPADAQPITLPAEVQPADIEGSEILPGDAPLPAAITVTRDDAPHGTDDTAPEPVLAPPVAMAIPVAVVSQPAARNVPQAQVSSETILPDDGNRFAQLPVAIQGRGARLSDKAEPGPPTAAPGAVSMPVLTAAPSAPPLTPPAANAVANPDASSAVPNPVTAPAQTSGNTGMEAALDHLAGLRDAARSARPEVVVRHGEFGVVSLRIDASTPGDWRATLTSRDPGFVPAVQAALAERAIAASDPSPGAGTHSGSNGGGRGGDTASGQQPGGQAGSHGNYGSSPGSGQGSQQPYLAQTQIGGRKDAQPSDRHTGAPQAEPSAERGLFA